MSDEGRQLRTIIAAQRKDLEELREFSTAELRQCDIELADQAKTIADLELRASQIARVSEDKVLLSGKREETLLSDLKRLTAENEELRAEVASLRRNESQDLNTSVIRVEKWGGSGSTNVGSALKENVTIKLARKQMATRFKLLAAYNLANLRKRRFWDPRSHRNASFVCSIVDGGYETAIP